jgi:serine phosphatase RsbU (regulator of sigma subunit)
VLYSDGITEAEDPSGQPLEEAGLENIVASYSSFSAAEIGTAVLKAVEVHAKASRFGDDLTILILKRYSTA